VSAPDVTPIRRGADALPSSWQPVDLGPVVAGLEAGEVVGPVPTLLERTDGAALLYPGVITALQGEPEACKGWIMLLAAAQVLPEGAVLYLDFEDTAASIVERLLALGVKPGAIVERFAYVRPSAPFAARELQTLLEARPYALAVIDGVGEAYTLLGLDPTSNSDAAKFLMALPRPIADSGAAVVEIDHVSKAKDANHRYPIGAQHKLAGVTAAFSVEAVERPSRSAPGKAKVRVQKDRPGHVRSRAVGKVIAVAHIVPDDGGKRVTVTLEPPGAASGADEPFRPTCLMGRVSAFLELEPGAGSKAIREGVHGKDKYVDAALQCLIDEGFVERRPGEGKGGGHAHFNVRRFDEAVEHW
jgi:hypothetical protein